MPAADQDEVERQQRQEEQRSEPMVVRLLDGADSQHAGECPRLTGVVDDLLDVHAGRDQPDHQHDDALREGEPIEDGAEQAGEVGDDQVDGLVEKAEDAHGVSRGEGAVLPARLCE